MVDLVKKLLAVAELRKALKPTYMWKGCPGRLTKSTPGYTFPKLGVADHRRDTPIVDSGLPLDNKRKLMHAAAYDAHRHLVDAGLATIQSASPEGDEAGAASTYAPISYARSAASKGPKMAHTLHDTSELSTQLHEDVHRMFGRVEEKHGPRARTNLARNLVMSLPPAQRMRAQNFAEWKSPRNKGNHEETIAHLISYLNDSGQRRRYREEKLNFTGSTPYRSGGVFPGTHKHPRARPYMTPDGKLLPYGQDRWQPDRQRQELRPEFRDPGAWDVKGRDAALAHDQAMKAAHRHLQAVTQDADESWLQPRIN